VPGHGEQEIIVTPPAVRKIPSLQDAWERDKITGCCGRRKDEVEIFVAVEEKWK
jgi:hypothetical protein